MTTSTGRSRYTEKLWRRLPSYLLALAFLAGCQDRSFLTDLKSPDVAVRVRAIEFLGSQRDRGAIPQLIDALRDTVVEVKAKAAWALGMVQAKAAVESKQTPAWPMKTDHGHRAAEQLFEGIAFGAAGFVEISGRLAAALTSPGICSIWRSTSRIVMRRLFEAEQSTV